YSSLANFRNMPVSELKIDKGFVIDMLKNQGDEKIVRVIVDLAHTFRLSVVAEGVENQGILKALAGMQCDCAQGYYISKPLPADEFVKFIQDYRPPAM
ncbi:MAG: EAL domain-containing protein, partial [Gammaproteobacteria bacterium]|nr:EAL domain-containing protein [Gammaproteobacteria bacterium]